MHTKYSMDCYTPLEEIIKRCLETGINCIAIADHGTTEGALKMQRLAPFPVIVAEEILTPHGEIMGMFLKETIPSGISIEQAISRIREQDGLVCLPHPFDMLRGIRLNGMELEALGKQLDIVEIYNARIPIPWSIKKAQSFAGKYEIPGTAGSDAHSVSEIGQTYIEMPEFNDKNDFLRAVAAGKIYGHRTNPLVHFKTSMARLKGLFSNAPKTK